MTWRTEVSELPDLSPAEFDFSLPTTGLVIVDMQFVDAHRDYGLGASLRESHPNVWDYYFARVEGLVVPNCRRLLNAFREKELRVIHLTIGPVLDDGSDMVRLRRPRTAPGLTPLLHHQGTFEHGILPEVAPLDGELVINKTSRSAFNSTAIERGAAQPWPRDPRRRRRLDQLVRRDHRPRRCRPRLPGRDRRGRHSRAGRAVA